MMMTIGMPVTAKTIPNKAMEKEGGIKMSDVRSFRQVFPGIRFISSLGCCLFFLLSLSPRIGAQNRWIFYGESELSKAYYDSQTVERLSNGNVRCWDKDVFSDLGREFNARQYPSMRGAWVMQAFVEYSPARKQRTWTVTCFDKAGLPLGRVDVPWPEWTPITPDSSGEKLWRMLFER